MTTTDSSGSFFIEQCLSSTSLSGIRSSDIGGIENIMKKLAQWISITALMAFAVFISEPGKAQEAEEKTVTQDDYIFRAQATVVTQGHYPFTSPYEGKKSLISHEDAQTSITTTFYGGTKLGNWGEFYLNPELSAGSGLSQTQGIAGFPNGEIYRVDNPTPQWSIARFYYKTVFGFGGGSQKIEGDINQVATTYDVQRFSVVLGKFALNDFFDNNTYSHDPRTQFLNWTLMDFGAWDYAADTRGYTWGVYLEYNQKDWALRFASALEPESANEMNYDMNISKAHAENLEFEYRYSYDTRPGAVRLLAYNNNAYMGNYREATAAPVAQKDITTTRSYSNKYGFGASLEQKIADNVGIFSRISWNDGKTETWTFTEIDQSISAGVVWNPHFFKKFDDTVGAALIVNDLSADHRDYLAAGGYGFIIGDGKLNYSSEKIFETYYLIKVNKEAAVTFDYQFVGSPAYNEDRGPVSIFALRLHYEI